MEIKIDKTTLPEDGQIVKFYDGDEWRDGEYLAEDEMFYVSPKEWYWAWQIHEWEPIHEWGPINYRAMRP